MSKLIEYTRVSNEVPFWECARDYATREDVGYAYMKEDGNFQNVLNVDTLLMEYERSNLFTFKKETCVDRARDYIQANLSEDYYLYDLVAGGVSLKINCTREQLKELAKAILGE